MSSLIRWTRLFWGIRPIHQQKINKAKMIKSYLVKESSLDTYRIGCAVEIVVGIVASGMILQANGFVA